MGNLLWYVSLYLIFTLLFELVVFAFIMIFICIFEDTKIGQIIYKKLRKHWHIGE